MKGLLNININMRKGGKLPQISTFCEVLADKSLTNDEKTFAIRSLNKDYDREKLYFEGTKRICEN